MSSYDFICVYAVHSDTDKKRSTIIGVVVNGVFYFTPKDLCMQHTQFPVLSPVTIADIREYVRILPVVSNLENIFKFIKHCKSFENETIESLKEQLDDIHFDFEHYCAWEYFLN